MFQKIYKSCCLFESKPIRNIVLKINGAEKKSCSKLIIIPLKFYRKEKSPIVDLIEVQPVANYQKYLITSLNISTRKKDSKELCECVLIESLFRTLILDLEDTRIKYFSYYLRVFFLFIFQKSME